MTKCRRSSLLLRWFLSIAMNYCGVTKKKKGWKGNCYNLRQICLQVVPRWGCLLTEKRERMSQWCFFWTSSSKSCHCALMKRESLLQSMRLTFSDWEATWKISWDLFNFSLFVWAQCRQLCCRGVNFLFFFFLFFYMNVTVWRKNTRHFGDHVCRYQTLHQRCEFVFVFVGANIL